jgi:hypothetical protein
VTHPDDDTLAAIALGEPAPPAAVEHARGCPTCSDALASLRDTMTALRAPVPSLVAPPASVWDAVEAELDREAGTGAPASGFATAPDAAPAPDVAPVPDVAPGSAPPVDDLSRRRAARDTRRRFPLAWVAGAAAAGLVIGVVGTRVLGEEPAPSTVTVASTQLDTLDTRQARGTADVVRHDGRLDLSVSTQPIDPDGGYLEVWLINKDLKRMVSVGVLDPAASGQSFAIPKELLDQGYVIVDISREHFDDSPQHSGDSVVRGTLAT